MKGRGDKTMKDKICKNPNLESQHHKVTKNSQSHSHSVRAAWKCHVRMPPEDRDHENGVFAAWTHLTSDLYQLSD